MACSETRMNKPILILGGGQLGLMMAEAGIHLGVVVDRLDTATGKVIPGTSDLRVEMSLQEIENRYAMITAEMEHLPNDALTNQLRNLPLWMNKEAFEILPSRRFQKEMLDRIQVPNAKWTVLKEADEIDHAHRNLGKTLVVKMTRGGYDGKGQWVIQEGAAHNLPDDHFGELIAEEMVPFSREVSLVGARNRKGETYFYPLVENYHHNGILRFTLAPATHTQNNRGLQSQGEEMLTGIMEALNYVGVIEERLYFYLTDDLEDYFRIFADLVLRNLL